MQTHITKPIKPLRIAILGGGIGGLFAALCIHHFCAQSSRGVEIDIYEQARAIREIGAGIGVGVNAMKLAHNIGIGQKINDVAGRRKNVWITFRRFDTGEDIITVPLDDRKTVRQAPVHRAEFLDILYRECVTRNAAQLHINKKCVAVKENTDDTVTIDFRDGSSATVDLLIGADGIHSVVRETYIKDNAVYCGQIAYRGVVPIEKVEPFWKLNTYSVNWVAHDRHMLVYPISQNTRLNVVAFVNLPEDKLGGLRESWSSHSSREEMLKDMEGFEDTAMKVLALMPEQVLKWKLNDRDPFEPWVFAGGKIVLVGDACHAVLPHQGAGGGQAMEDGYALGLALRDFLQTSETMKAFSPSNQVQNNSILEHYMKFYQWVRLPRAQKVQRTTREASRIYELQTPEFFNKSFEDCLPAFAKIMKGRMDWIWYEDLDEVYAKAAEIYPKWSSKSEIHSLNTIDM